MLNEYLTFDYLTFDYLTTFSFTNKNTIILIFIVIIFLIILISVLVFFVVYYGTLTNVSKLPNAPPPSFTTALTTCSPLDDNSCGVDLVCDPATYLCKYPTGTLCDSFSQCLTGEYCSGICTSGPFGQIQQNCPCDQTPVGPFNGTLICTPSLTTPGLNVCLGGENYPCSLDNQCATGVCSANLCTVGLPFGSPCTSNNQCESNAISAVVTAGNCSDGYCQPLNVTTGTVGASCNPEEGFAPCGSGNVCFNGLCQANPTFTGMLQICTQNGTLCSNTLTCLQMNNGEACTTCLGGTNICGFQFAPGITPNNSSSGLCIINYTQVNTTCLPQNFQGSNSTINCATGLECNLPGVIEQIVAIDPNDQSLFVGAGQFNYMNVIGSFFPDFFAPTRIFMFQGIFYGLDLNNGLFSYQTGNAIVGTSFVFNSVTYTLVDAFSRSGLFLIAGFDGVTNYLLFTSDGNSVTGVFNSGIQMTLSMINLTISRIDISGATDVLIQDTNMITYTKASTVTLYTQIISVPVGNVSPSFYPDASAGTSDTNVAYIDNYISGTLNVGSVILFNNAPDTWLPGNKYPANMPFYQINAFQYIFSFTSGATLSQLTYITVATNINISTEAYIYVGYGTTTGSIMPGFVDVRSILSTDDNGNLFFYSPCICE
jgi:hypothetical protein